MTAATYLPRIALFALTTAIGTTASAAELWDNGAAINGVVNGAYPDAMDDVYVPGAGWFVNGVTTQGLFLAPGRTVEDVDVIIWGHDNATGEPDGSDTIIPAVQGFSVTSLGDTPDGYEQLRVSADIAETFLAGQAFYWIEIRVRDQYSQSLRLQASAESHWLPSRQVDGAATWPAASANLAFSLEGSEIKTMFVAPVGGFKIEGNDVKGHTKTLAIADGNARFPAGLYQLDVVKDVPQVFLINEFGRSRFDFRTPPRKPAKLHTPIGDDMCEGAPDLIYEFCQTFVACAAHDLFCHF